MQWIRAGLILGAVGSWVGGCGSGSSEEPARTTSNATTDSFARALAELACDYVASCHSEGPNALSDKVTPFLAGEATEDPDRCRVALGEMFVDTLGALGRAVEAGTVSYDPAAASACLEAASSECHPGLGWVLNEAFDDRWIFCPQAFVGSVPDGGSCRLDEECDENSYCEQNACPGTCTPRIPLGGECPEADRVCAGAWSRCGGSDIPVCAERQIEPMPGGEGDACDIIETTSTTERWRACARGLACVSGICVTRGTAGSSCSSHAECAPGFVCDANGACMALPVFEEGGPCPGEICGVLDIMACVNGVCTAGTELCLSHAQCADGEECIDERCGTPLSAGETCSANADCASGLCVNDTGTCCG